MSRHVARSVLTVRGYLLNCRAQVYLHDYSGPVVQSDATVNEPRTTLSLSLTVSDKIALIIMVAKKGTKISAIIHGWIEEYIEKKGV